MPFRVASGGAGLQARDSPRTSPAPIAALNMDDAGEIAQARFRTCSARRVLAFRQVPSEGCRKEPRDSGARNAQGKEHDDRRARDPDLEERNDHVATPKAMTPNDTMQAAARRLDLGPSLSQITPISAAKITEVSRNADTAPNGARVFA